MVEPFVLYVSKRFLDRASKTFGLGLIVRKPLVEILRRLNVSFNELGRDEAQEALNRVSESKGLNIALSQLIRNLALALFLPTGVLMASLKKVHFRSGVETNDYLILEFLAEIPRAFKPTLFYDIWVVVPKADSGESRVKELIKSIVERTNVPPLTDDEWNDLQPIVEKLKGKLEAKGVTENLWRSLY
ncbi:MAG: hypothetical protein RMH77_05975 [Sulfolobales archaeon]|nr:hypothetical protein [Sulfolobales archaeon]